MHPLRILVVDDYPATRCARIKILQGAGFDVVGAATAREALERVVAEAPDLVILHGFEVCRRIKGDPRTARVQVIHTTASFDRTDHVRGLELGADAYLIDPVEPEILLATVRSVARVRQAEHDARAAARDWQATFDAIHDGVCVLDAAGQIVRHNAMFGRLAGVAGDLAGRDGAEILARVLDQPGDSVPSLLGARERRLLERGVCDGWLQITIDPVPGDDGEPGGAVCILADISERKRLEQVRADYLAMERRAREEAEATGRAKDQFLAVLSHELRTPLTAMLGWTRLMATGRLGAAETRRALEVVERNTRLQASLIEDLLDVSRIVAGKLTLVTQTVGVSRILDAALESARSAAVAKGVALESRAAEDLGSVVADAARMQQAVANLLSNAVKFTPRSGHVTLTAELEGPRIRIAVQDTGCGIEAAFLPHVFEPFRQGAAGQGTIAGPGLGLGLAIVRHVVEMHGGSIDAASDGLGRGATFTILLTPADASVAAPGQPEPVATRLSLAGLRVLVVEDHQDTREVVAAALRRAGAEVVAVGSGQAGLDTFATAPPDVLVSDIGVPDLDGYELIRAVRRRPAADGGTVPAIALTAFARGDDQREALLAGYDRHVAKPVDPLALAAVVADVARPSAA